MKVALVYDRVNKWGGAERLLLVLHELFPYAPLFTSVYNKKTAPWADVFEVRTSLLQKFPDVLSHEYYAPLMPFAFESFNFDEFDLVISITSEAAKGIITKPETLHICYCLTPTRYLWSGYDTYFQNSLVRFGSKPFILYLRRWDLTTCERPDAYIAISKEVQARIKKYYQRESEVVYPPVTLASGEYLVSSSKNSAKRHPLDAKGYFLVVSRFVSYKRIDIAIKACNMLRLPLVIVGSGTEESYLRSIAGKTISFVGNLTDTELVAYYKSCTALIFPGYEDFGLTPLEANRFGRPVIALGKGGVTETIVDGKTGVFFPHQTVDSLVNALQRFQTMKFNQDACKHQAEKFNQRQFKKKFVRLVDSLYKNRMV